MLAALLAVGFPALAQADLPDLVADPPSRPLVEDLTHDGSTLRAMRFNGYLRNASTTAALEVNGADNVAGVMQVVSQHVFSPLEDIAMDEATLYYDDKDGHNHWHLRRAAMYSLWSADGSAMVAPAAKVGFCLTDSYNPVTGAETGTYNAGCAQNTPGAASVQMGMSPRFQDIYGRGLWYQWVDISNVAPGVYQLRTDIDPEDVIAESNEVNLPASRPVNVPGYVSNPVQATLAEGGATSVTLDADGIPEVRDSGDPFGAAPALGAAEYRIEDPPLHGTLSRPTGVWFSGATLDYTPSGAPQADSFTYSVREAGSPFPTSPPRTAVTLSVPPSSDEQPPPAQDEQPADAQQQQPPPPPPPVVVAISGAPVEMVAGTSVRLTANVPVSWSATAGRILPDGTYTASRTQPSATIRATAPGGAFAETVIRIVAATNPGPLPTACGKGATTATGALGRLCARYVRGAVLVSATPSKAGRLQITLRRGARVLKTCRWSAVKGRSYGCRFRTRRGRLSVVVKQRRAGKVVTKRLAVR